MHSYWQRLQSEWRRVQHALAALFHVGNTRSRVITLEAVQSEHTAYLIQLQERLSAAELQLMTTRAELTLTNTELAATRAELNAMRESIPQVIARTRYPRDLIVQRQLDQLRAEIPAPHVTAQLSAAPAPARFGDAPLPLLSAHPDNHHLIAHPNTLLYVGAFQPDHGQQRLLECLYALKSPALRQHQRAPDVALILASPAGARDDAYYLAVLRDHAAHLGIAAHVTLTPQVNAAKLAAAYHAADVYLSVAEPAVLTTPPAIRAIQQALYHDLLVLAYGVTAQSPVAQLIPPSGWLTALAADHVAAVIQQFWRDHRRRQSHWLAQRQLAGADPAALLAPPLTVRIEGPCDSSYSLALVNTGIARALHRAGDQVALYQTDGYGDTPPDRAFLATQPELAQLTRTRLRRVTVTLRNVYPPRTNALRGVVRVIGPYGWEESGFPKHWIRAFNRRLSGVLCLSDYVRDVLIANGLTVPAITTGLVADSLLNVTPQPPANLTLPGDYRLLHVSSGFPRKGVDVLLTAHRQLPAELALIIKTFANPHNVVFDQLLAHGYECADSHNAAVTNWTNHQRRVLVINGELTPAEMAWLYQQADQLIAPSRGEGFGLPLAEAMLFDCPVITTDSGGQRDFCTPATAWLIQSHPVPAQTHFNLPGSQWAEPDADHLRQQIETVMSTDAAERRAQLTRARLLIQSRYCGVAVAARIHAAVVELLY